jgi:fibronectin-binding autotransporter adhesin
MKPNRFSHHALLSASIASLLAAGSAQAANQTWDGGGGDEAWSTVNNWNGNTAAPGGASSNTDVATFNAAITNGWGSIDTPIWVDVGYLGGINFDGAAGSYYIDGDPLSLSNGGTIQILSSLTSTNAIQNIYPNLTIEGAGGQYTFANNSTSGIGANAGTLNILGAISGGAAGTTTLTLSGSNINSNTISGIISKGSATTLAVTKSGIGTWALSGANTFNGQLTVEEGTLQVATVNNSGSTSTASGPLGRSTLSVILGKAGGYTGTLEYTSASTYAPSTTNFTLASGGTGAFYVTNGGANLELTGLIDGSGALLKAGPGTLLLLGANTYSGTTTINGGTLTAGVAETAGTTGPFGTNTSAGSIIFDGGTLQYSTANQYDYSARLTTIGNKDYRIDTNSQTVSFASGLLVSGTSGLFKSGGGTLNLNAASTYTGLTTIQGGTLKLGINDAIKSGNAVTISNATADQTATLDLNGYAVTVGGAGLTLGGYNASNTAQVTGTGAGSVLTLSGGSTALTYSAANNPQGAVISATTVDLNNATQTFTVGNSSSAANDLSVSSAIRNGALTKDGAGTLTLTGTNTYSGQTTISAGVVQLGNGSTTGELNPSSAIVNNGTLTFNRSDTLTQGTHFNSAISGTGNVIQTTGTVVLNGSNTYQGGTTVNGGTLVVNNTSGSGTGSGAVVIESGATLKGNGTLGGNVTIHGAHSPGNSPGVQTINGNLDYSGANSVFNWELTRNTSTQGTSPDYVFDQVNVGGNLTIDSSATFNILLKSTGSDVLFSDTFWDVAHQWQVFNVSGTDLNNFQHLTVSLDTDNLPYTSAPPPAMNPSAGFSYSGGYVYWTAVPEPSTALAGLLLAAGLLRRRRNS